MNLSLNLVLFPKEKHLLASQALLISKFDRIFFTVHSSSSTFSSVSLWWSWESEISPLYFKSLSKFMKMENCSSVLNKIKSQKWSSGKWKNYSFKRNNFKMQYSINREILHRSKLLRLGILKIYSIERVIRLTNIPLSGLDYIYIYVYIYIEIFL